jgi:Ca-activated chloride channel family protein
VKPGVVSRVIVLSDGDANVGTTSQHGLMEMIADRVEAGVTLSTIGFGVGNYRDGLMEQLGDRGNGNNYYVDSAAAAEKLFTTDLVAVLEVAAKDVKLQVEFDPALVARYRLLGYENRDVKDSDFRVDAVDAGEIGAGHQVTALYEVQLTAKATQTTPLGAVRIRYKHPEGKLASEAMFAMPSGPATSFEVAPSDFRFAVAVAGFADLLRGAEDAQRWSLARMAEVARANTGGRPERLELVGLIERAAAIR